jgi:hypothetical protein
MIIQVIRDDDPDQPHNVGTMLIDGKHFGETLEDKDRFLEAGETKVPNDTAIPRGRYRVILSDSERFRRVMPEVLDVPGFSGVRIHGGNTTADTSGCVLLGSVRTAGGVASCHGINERLIDRIGEALGDNEEVWLEIV